MYMHRLCTLFIFDKLNQSNYPLTHSQYFNAVGTCTQKNCLNETVILNAQSKPKMLDKKIFTILCWIFLSRPMLLDLYREKTQIRLRIYNTDTSKLEKMLHFGMHHYINLCSFSYNSDKPHCSVMF